MGYSAHCGYIYITVRSLTDVVQVRVPQTGAFYIQLLHNQATQEKSTVLSGTLLGSSLAQHHPLSPDDVLLPLFPITLVSPTHLFFFLFRGQS